MSGLVRFGLFGMRQAAADSLSTEDVCEDAVTIKQDSGTSTISGGGFKSAEDKVIQHNGGGTVVIQDICVQDFGKVTCILQRSRPVSDQSLSSTAPVETVTR
jgi:hypothetical protein